MTEIEPRPAIRALVASFLFTDLVGFSKGTVAEQCAAKATLSEILRKDLATLRESDYRIKDTGDGALMTFLSNPEHALYMALAITHDFAKAADGGGFPSNSLRTGIHLGTVKEAMDVEARPNFIGDGINAAKRIMDFASPGQIAASRSFFEAVACLDASYAALFRHLGALDDKHGRVHELYAVSPNAMVLENLRLNLTVTPREREAFNVETQVIAGERTGAPVALVGDSQAALGQAIEVVRKWFIPIIALIAVTVFAAAGLERVAPSARGIRIASATLFAVAIMVGSLDLLRAQGIGSQFWVRNPRTALALASRPTSLVAIVIATMLGIVSIFLGAWRPEAIVPTTHTLTGTPGLPASTMGGPAAPPTAAEVPPFAAPKRPPKSEAAISLDPSRVAESAAAPELALPISVPELDTTHTQVDMKPPPRAAPTTIAPFNAKPDRGSVRCTYIVEKAAIGEPLSPDEKRDLANLCR